MLNWIGFNPETHRAYVGADGMPVIESVPSEILEMRQLDTDNARFEKAVELVKKGLIVDKAIDVDCWGAKGVMALRQAYGYVWVPSFMQPRVTIAPGLGQPGSSPYDPGAAAPGSILVPPPA